MPDYKKQDEDVNFKGLFLPFTTKKAIVFIFLIGFIVFFNALFGQFTWDDEGFIRDNIQVHSVNLSVLFQHNNAFNDAGYYRPLSATYFAIIYSVFGAQPFFFHLIQIFIHVINSILIFIFFRKLFKEKLALFLSIIFLIHPINVESVSYIGASQSVLLLFFGLSAVLLDQVKKNSLLKTVGIFSFLLLSLLVKETGLLFFLIILAYRFIFIKQQNLLYSLGSILTLIIYLLIRFSTGNGYLFKIPFIPIALLPLAQRLLNIPEIIFYYLKTIIFPLNLVIEQQWIIEKTNFNNFFFPLLIILGLTAIMLKIFIKLYKEDKVKLKQFSFFVFWFVIGLGLLLQIFPLDMTVADRWFYFPFVGLLGIVGVVITKYSKLINNKYFLTIAILLIIILSARTIIRNNDWYDTLTLLKHDTQIQTNFDNENNLGKAYGQIDDIENALVHFKKSVLLDPFELNLTNLGGAYLSLNKPEIAKQYLLMALSAKRYSDFEHKHGLNVYINLGTYYCFYDDPSKAMPLLVDAIKDYPDSGKLYYLLAVSQYLSNEKEQALQNIQKAYAISPTPQVKYAYKQISNNLPLAIKK